MSARRQGKRPGLPLPDGPRVKHRRDEAYRSPEQPPAAPPPSNEAFSVRGMVEGLLPTLGAAEVVQSKMAARSVMLDNTPSAHAAADDPKKAERSRGPKLSRKQLRQLGLSRIVQAEGCRFADFLPLHSLWNGYISELLGPEGGGSAMADKLTKADYHGAMICVARSKCPSLVGVSGIVLQETEHTFRIMCQDDRPRTVPKRNSVFTLRHGKHLITIHGNHICFRASERARHKFKARPTCDL